MESERRRIWIGLISAVLLTLLVFVGGGCAANTYTVCPDGGCNYTSIQAAIDVAQSGDTIEVYCGTYYENVVMKEGISLRGAGADVTTVAAQSGYVITGAPNSLIDGFTIDGISPVHPHSCIHDWASSLKITNNTIINSYYGIFCVAGSTTTIANNRIYNSCINVYVVQANPTISNNIIANSSVWNIQLYNSESKILNNTISNSKSDGIVCHLNATGTFSNNLFLNNNRHGIICLRHSSPLITYNTFTGNFGDGICCDFYYYGGSFPTISNNIIVDNAGYGVSHYDNSVSPKILYNDVWNNTLGGYYNCSEGLGDIATDPFFVDPTNGDFHLQADSPCCGAGENGTDIGAFPCAGNVPTANFTADVTAGYVPLTVHFIDTSLGNPTSWEWDLGDGNTSEEQNPIHAYLYLAIMTSV